MTSNNRKDDIQKSIAESLLEEVTHFQKDETPNNTYDNSRNKSEVDLIIEEEPEGGSIWNFAKLPPPLSPFESLPRSSNITNSEAVEPENKVVDSAISELNTKQISANVVTSKSEQKTIAVSQVEFKNTPETNRFGKAYGSTPTFDFTPQKLANLNAIQLKLYEGDHLKIAQQKIEELGREVDRLRIENEKLASASDLFQRSSEDHLAVRLDIEKKLSHNESRFSEERLTLKNHLEQRDVQIKELKDKIEDLESRLSNDIRKSRSRERELENRLELARLEKISLVGSKDDIILDLKRQVDQLNHELGNYRRKAAEMNQTIDANQEQFRRTVRALRLALTNLEVNEQIGSRSKKAE